MNAQHELFIPPISPVQTKPRHGRAGLKAEDLRETPEETLKKVRPTLRARQKQDMKTGRTLDRAAATNQFALSVVPEEPEPNRMYAP